MGGQSDSKEVLQNLGSVLANLQGPLLIASLGCYSAGFFIANIYLASLGILAFDLLRARYILVGLLFIFFLATIAIPLAGLMRVLREYGSEHLAQVLFALFAYSVAAYGAVFFLAMAFGSIAVLLGRGDPFVSILGPRGWEEWWNYSQPFLIQDLQILATVLAIPAAWALGAFLYMFVRMRARPVPERLQLTREYLSKPHGPMSPEFARQLVIMLGLLVFAAIVQSLPFFQSASSARYELLPGGMDRFVGVSVLLYALAASVVTVFNLVNKPDSKMKAPDAPDAPGEQVTALVAFVTLLALLIFVVPTYALGVYPHAPQHIGGGAAVPVRLLVSSASMRRLISGPGLELYLIDRGANGALFLLTKVHGERKVRVLEVMPSEVLSIVYGTAP